MHPTLVHLLTLLPPPLILPLAPYHCANFLSSMKAQLILSCFVTPSFVIFAIYLFTVFPNYVTSTRHKSILFAPISPAPIKMSSILSQICVESMSYEKKQKRTKEKRNCSRSHVVLSSEFTKHVSI